MKKIISYAILIFIVLGFTLPGFVDLPSGPKFCAVDNDCSIKCAGINYKINCYFGQCQVSNCEQAKFLNQDFKQGAVSIKLDNESLPYSPSDLTVNESGWVGDLVLNQLLYKSNYLLTDSCLITGVGQYCGNVKLEINGEENFMFGNYVPNDGDIININIYNVTSNLTFQ